LSTATTAATANKAIEMKPATAANPSHASFNRFNDIDSPNILMLTQGRNTAMMPISAHTTIANLCLCIKNL